MREVIYNFLNILLYLNIILLFFLDVNDSMHFEDSLPAKQLRPKVLIHPDTKDADNAKTYTIKVTLSLGSAAILFITLCVAIAAIIARYQKRGRKTKYNFDEPTVEFSKLIN